MAAPSTPIRSNSEYIFSRTRWAISRGRISLSRRSFRMARLTSSCGMRLPGRRMPQLEVNRAIRKLRRLSEMRPREIAHRVREKMYSELERIGVDGAAIPEAGSFKDQLAAAASRFYFRDPERLAAFVQQQFPHWVDRAVEEAERLCRHNVELLGYGPIELGAEIDWHRDPLTGRTWEGRFWTDYDLTRDCSAGDPKTIHELNRHQHLPRLAKAYLWTGNERYAAEAVAQLTSWIEQNPPGWGIHWHSSLEIGIRAVSWLWTVFLLLPYRAMDQKAASCIGRSLFAQLDHVRRHLSIFSSPNTHLIGEAAALFIAGLVFRDQTPATEWLETGAALLAEEAQKQVLEDGVYGELSSYYHCYALDFYLQALALADRNGFPFPSEVRQKVGAMLEFLLHLTRPDGTIPLLGDDDGGRALALVKRDYLSFSEALCVGAVLFGRKDFKQQGGEFAEEALWLLGEDAWMVYGLLESKPPAKTRAFYPRAGYLIERTGWGPLDSHLVFDCGGLGMVSGGHAHADALSLTLFTGGRELLVDPGTFLYNGAPEWRRYFRSTRAHNTVVIDDRDQAEPGDTFRWKTKLDSRVVEHRDLPEFGYVEAEHDGYERDAPGVVHRRRLLYVKPEYWVVVDDFRGSGRHTFDFLYHFAPGVEISFPEGRGDGSSLTLLARAGPAVLSLSICASAVLEMKLIDGWGSTGYGRKEPSQTWRVRLDA